MLLFTGVLCPLQRKDEKKTSLLPGVFLPLSRLELRVSVKSSIEPIKVMATYIMFTEIQMFEISKFSVNSEYFKPFSQNRLKNIGRKEATLVHVLL